MLKNRFFILMACFLFLIAGCAKSGSTGTVYITGPARDEGPGGQPGAPQYVAPFLLNVTDLEGNGFEGAELLLVNDETGEQYRIPITDVACAFDRIPYGTYTLTVPDYSEQNHRIVVDGNWTGETYPFSRMNINVVVEVFGEAYGQNAEDYFELLHVWLSDGGKNLRILELDEEEGVYRGTVPAGRYSLLVSHEYIEYQFMALAHDTIDVNRQSSYFPEEVQEYENGAVFQIPMPYGREIGVTLDGRVPDFIYYNEYLQAFIAVYISDEAGEQTIRVQAEGFKDYSGDFDITALGDYDVLLTPQAAAKSTVAIVSVHVHGWTPSFSAGMATPVFTLGGLLPPDFVSSLIEVDYYGQPSSLMSPPLFRALFYLDEDEYEETLPLSITADGYLPFGGGTDFIERDRVRLKICTMFAF